MGLDFRKRSGRIANGSLLIVPGQTINGVKVYQTTFSQKKSQNNKPMGPEIPLPTPTPTNTSTPLPTPTSTPIPTPTSTPIPTNTPTTTPTQTPTNTPTSTPIPTITPTTTPTQTPTPTPTSTVESLLNAIITNSYEYIIVGSNEYLEY
jgi:hypothetical protein